MGQKSAKLEIVKSSKFELLLLQMLTSLPQIEKMDCKIILMTNGSSEGLIFSIVCLSPSFCFFILPHHYSNQFITIACYKLVEFYWRCVYKYIHTQANSVRLRI